MTLMKKTAAELQALLHNREVSVKEVTEDSFKQIAALDGQVKAFLALTEEEALVKAQNLDNSPKEGRGPTVRIADRY